MRSIFTEEEPELSLPYSTLCWTSTSIFLHFHLPPLPCSAYLGDLIGGGGTEGGQLGAPLSSTSGA